VNQKIDQEIIPDYICKIEGHGTLNINFEECKAPLRVLEGERLFEGFMLGRDHQDAPFITARICGICPTVHCLTSICALENALDVEVSPETEMIRKLLLAAQIVQSHTLHAFFLALPDYLDVEDAIQIARKYPVEFRAALDLKRFSDNLIAVVGGRAVHPLTPQVSGFDRLPSEKQLSEIRRDAEKVIGEAEATVGFFGNLAYPEVSCPTQFLAAKQRKDEYTIYNASRIASSTHKDFDVVDYDHTIKETVTPFSTAKFSTKESKSFAVGALARLNLNKDYLSPKTGKSLPGLSVGFPSDNPFHNNLAQAVEIRHFTEEIIELLDRLLKSDLENARTFDYHVRAGYGVGACEAPRGTLYHAYELNEQGIVIKCNVITPTAQNLSNIEDDACTLLEQTQDLPEGERRHLLEMLIRAYDPCITCSVH
jgi:coenzyme F420-reducing hydrogenase alpha subunit